MDIHNKDFKRSFRGYDEDEIDEFLDQVVNDYERLYRENDQLKKDLDRSKKANADYVSREQTIKDTLVMAQKTAEEVTKSAKENAAAMKEASARDCQNMRRQAELDCKEMRDKAENEIRQGILEAHDRVQRIVEEYDRLVRAKNEYLAKVRASLAQEVAVLDQTLKELPDPSEAERTTGEADARAKKAAGGIVKSAAKPSFSPVPHLSAEAHPGAGRMPATDAPAAKEAPEA